MHTKECISVRNMHTHSKYGERETGEEGEKEIQSFPHPFAALELESHQYLGSSYMFLPSQTSIPQKEPLF